MNKDVKEALAEVDKLLSIMPEEISQKIPEKFLRFISENKSKTFDSTAIDGNIIEEDKLKHETDLILALIYQLYLK